MKPNEGIVNVGNGELILRQEDQVKLESESSPVSEALQLFLAESVVDPKALMIDLSKFLQENPNLGHVNNQQRVIVSAPSSNPTMSSIPTSSGSGVPIPGRRNEPSFIDRGDIIMDYIDETFPGVDTATPSSGIGVGAGSSSYGTSPGGQISHSPSYWEQSQVQIKEEFDSPIMQLSGNQHHAYSPGEASGGLVGSAPAIYTTLANTGPTLAQLNSPDFTEATTLGDLDSLNLDLEALTGDMMLPYQTQISSIKVEPSGGLSPGPSSSLLEWNRQPTQLSTSVPVSVISSVADFQELSNLSNGGPAVSPRRLTLSPPIAGQGLSPQSQPLSPQQQGLMGSSADLKLSPQQSSQQSSASALHQLLLRQENPVPDPIRPRSNSNQFKSARRPIAARQRNSSISNPLLASQQSKNTPVKTLPIEQMIWSRRDPRPHMNSVCSNAGDSSLADEVSEVLNNLSPADLNDIDSEDEEESGQEQGSDEDLRIDEDDGEQSGSSKKERYFWQYNVQAKGPKGQKLALDTKITDPHRLNEIIDPVFSDHVQVHGIKHSGKARRGDGNDLTANPKKLAAIGKELEKLNKEINLMTPVSEVPLSTRTNSRKEKNKLASRACRLKKKAQHEANKLKLHGLEEEHRDLMQSLTRVKDILLAKWGDANRPQDELTQEAERILKKATKNKVAGQTTDYVNRMIGKYS